MSAAKRRTSVHPVAMEGRLAANAIALLTQTDHVGTGASGALRFARGAESVGAILIEGGRVCWAAAGRTRRRLTDLLLEGAAVELGREELEAIVRRCCDEGRPLGETLVSGGFLTAESLRDALLWHTTESLMTLAAEGALESKWIPRQGSSYDPRFTFPPAVLVDALGKRADARRSAEALLEMQRVLPPGTAGIVFARFAPGQVPAPMACVGDVDLSVGDFARLARWTAERFDLAGMFADVGAVQSLSPMGVSWVAWSSPGLLMVAICSRRGECTRVLHNLATRAPEDEKAS